MARGWGSGETSSGREKSVKQLSLSSGYRWRMGYKQDCGKVTNAETPALSLPIEPCKLSLSKGQKMVVKAKTGRRPIRAI
jgi:hypothetical protein